MREIKFRGKRVDNGEWVYGWYATDDLGKTINHYISQHNYSSEMAVKVIPETVDQYTGMKDKNGEDIYEGGIINFARKRRICPVCSAKDIESEITYSVSKFCPNCGKEVKDTDFITTSKVVFDNGGFAYQWSSKESYYQQWQTHVAEVYISWIEVIGNIHDNPELLTK